MDPRPQLPEQYSAEIVRSDEDGERHFVYADGPKFRQETHFPNGRCTIVISRPDKKVAWSLAPETKTYSQIKFTEEMSKSAARFIDSLYDWRVDGAEMIDGRQCHRFVGRYRLQNGSSGAAHEVHYIDVKTHMPRREITFDRKGNQALKIDCLNVIIGSPPSELFEIPTGFKRAYNKKATIPVGEAAKGDKTSHK